MSLICASAQDRTFIDRVYETSLGQHLPYRVIYPENFDPGRKYPLVLFLHGSGERGRDGRMQTKHGESLFLSDAFKDVLFVAPQCPKEDFWVLKEDTPAGYESFPYDAPPSVSAFGVKELLDSMISLGFVDESALYCTGLSMGAYGTWDLMLRYPDLFAAVQPICGGVNIDRLKEYKGKTAIRIFHGLEDDIVPPEFSLEAYEALKSIGADVSMITYPGVRHNSWDNAFAEPDFVTWFFRYRR